VTILASGGEVYDGQHAAARYYSVSRKAFPDQRHKLIAMHHADDAVIVEFDPMGTHKEPLGSVAPTGREFTCRMAAIFFSEGIRRIRSPASVFTSIPLPSSANWGSRHPQHNCAFDRGEANPSFFEGTRVQDCYAARYLRARVTTSALYCPASPGACTSGTNCAMSHWISAWILLSI
jgi:SnoaL-like polyketide cyclase